MAAFNIKEQFLKKPSKAQCLNIVKWVGADQQHFDALFHIFLTGQYREVQHAAWPISYCVIAHPQLIKKHWGNMIKNLQKPGIHDAVKRNSMRLIQEIDIPQKYAGAVMEIAFTYLAAVKEPIAVRVFSMTVLANLSKKYPEILPELKVLVEDILPHASAGFKSRTKKLFNL